MVARTNEIETEDHLLKIADREEGRLNQEINRIQKEMEELKEQKNIYEVHRPTLISMLLVKLVSMYQFCKSWSLIS